ncbi:MAG: SDR family NAD(P)-dependent oxidoreductase, partial [Gammaproteobacteria bacterium]
MKSLEGKVAIVTGSGQGVGEGIALALSSYGVKVALLGRTFNKVEAVASSILKSGGIAIPIECDVKNLASIEDAIAL